MLLSTLYWPDEIRSVGELDLPEEEFDFKPAERTMAQQLVQAMKGEFKPEDYKDEYREALVAVLEAKVAGKPAKLPKASEAPTKIADLMSVLEASVAAVREAREAAGSKTAKSKTGDKAASAKSATSKSAKVSDIGSGAKRAARKAEPAAAAKRKTA